MSNATLRPNSNSTEIKKTRSALSVDKQTEETVLPSEATNTQHLGKLLSVLSLFLPNWKYFKEGCFCLANNSVKANLFLAYNGFILQHSKTRLYSEQAAQTPVNTTKTPQKHSSFLKDPAWSETLVYKMSSPSTTTVLSAEEKASHGLSQTSVVLQHGTLLRQRGGKEMP